MSVSRAAIREALQRDILRLEGFNSPSSTLLNIGLGPLRHAFPNAAFPLGAMHEFLSNRAEETAATTGFVSGLLASILGDHGTAMWIGSSRKLFPPALKLFGLAPDRFIFVDVQKEKDVLWVMNEALKCPALKAVVGEVRELGFTESRRLQLAVEESQVTGFVLNAMPRKVNTTACVSRWKITPLPSEVYDDLPGIGFPRWRVELLRMRNGKTGTWELTWKDGAFAAEEEVIFTIHRNQKAG
jgi:protein ImuA